MSRETNAAGGAAARRWGFPEPRVGSLAGSSAEPELVGAQGMRRAEKVETRPGTVGAVTTCTMDHLHFARTLAASLLRHEPKLSVFVVIADWDGLEDPDVGPATPLAGGQLGVDHFPYMALKYSARDLCCALKPAGIRHLASKGIDKILYVDADLYFLSPLTRLLEALDEHPWVVTPHTIAPLTQSDGGGERPSMGDLAAAGVYNAGLFGLRSTAETLDFVETWETMVTGPGAFRESQTEQHAFNWVSCFLDGVKVLRDTAYNVAYWNLHDRCLRHRTADGRDEWRVDGRPLVAFHFSGFSFDEPTRLSRHDARYSLYLLPALARLVQVYVKDLARHGASLAGATDYRFDRFPSGLEIDERMRRCFRDHEVFLWRDLDPFTPEGEAHYCRSLLLPAPSTYLAPVLLWRLYCERADLQSGYRHSQLDPSGLLRWFAEFGSREYGYTELFDRFRPVVPKLEVFESLEELEPRAPGIFRDLEQPLGADRRRFVERLIQAGRAEEGCLWLGDTYEYFDLSDIYLARSLVRERSDLRLSFPDLLGEDAERLADWFATEGVSSHFLPPTLAQTFRECASGRSLARIFSFINRHPLAEGFPLALVGEDQGSFAERLFEILAGNPEFDLDDVVMYLWVMEEAPWAGLPLTLELLANSRRWPSPLEAAGQEQLLAPVLARDPRFREALDDYRAEQSRVEPAEALAIAAAAATRFGPATVLEGHRHPAEGEIGETSLDRGSDGPGGVNFFGYFKSPIGLGHLSRGLAGALERAGVPVQENLVGNIAMERKLTPADFVRSYRYSYGINLFASYPHLNDRLPSLYPKQIWHDRMNVAYLAWELRDGSPYWPSVFAEFDQVWALSSFAAISLSQAMDREVLSIPCVVDFEGFPEPASKVEVGLDPEKFQFLFVFDANSSIERKNPEAVIDAFARAFGPREPVQLILKVSNAHRLDHRRRLDRLRRHAAATGLDIRFLLGNLPRAGLLRLLSAVDCYVSLHRAEGFGYTCAEAMGFGLPVIATGYSGNLEFMNEGNSFLVDFREVTITSPDGPFQRGSVWAEPSVEHAGQLMRRVFEDPVAAHRRGGRAAAQVRHWLSADRIGLLSRRALQGGGRAATLPRRAPRPGDGRVEAATGPRLLEPASQGSRLLRSIRGWR